MRVFALILFYVSRVLAVLAVLAGLAAGLLVFTFGVAFVCFDTCPSPDDYFARFVGEMWMTWPCGALAALALTTFVAYCVATGQARRAIMQTIVFLGGGLVCVATFDAVFHWCQSTLPVTQYYQVEEGPAEAWMARLGLTVIIVTGVWTSVLGGLQWGRGAQQNQTALV